MSPGLMGRVAKIFDVACTIPLTSQVSEQLIRLHQGVTTGTGWKMYLDVFVF